MYIQKVENMGDLKKKKDKEENKVILEDEQIIERLRSYIQKFYEIQEEKNDDEIKDKEES